MHFTVERMRLIKMLENVRRKLPGQKKKEKDDCEESFFVRQACFLGAKDPYQSLKTARHCALTPRVRVAQELARPRVYGFSTSLMPPHLALANIEQPQNSRPACWPVLARRNTMPLPQRGHFGRRRTVLKMVPLSIIDIRPRGFYETSNVKSP
ncbi:hypothetical protein SBV1_2880005 [Verrucomicrobia bacterium]|nr:hypothetical protein SBV1_2880005 [Verrucomicrobiota bacterium]